VSIGIAFAPGHDTQHRSLSWADCEDSLLDGGEGGLGRAGLFLPLGEAELLRQPAADQQRLGVLVPRILGLGDGAAFVGVLQSVAGLADVVKFGWAYPTVIG
jgi:hypothetical protein